ncbi:osomolarity two-component system, response regulator SKN7 [Geosmithia morbida]|uniref:Transcription factor n=1 Tax=Geosmithia morbida TaxID=1094350 RepID=A0A9P5D369_9HYPO|nr:osomolarity two-component system, response regulator SKN7 [Geosmithia morbida]KAF4121505.1 osomolarity two-component system, response regulator SKN7 [Geosmithia morbida]
MSGTEMAPTSGGGSNASEFPLYSMLEDPSHQDVARWGKVGDSFVVVEGEKFTRSILPKHFKHSNMSSFIRQLNKYDFHKVKPSGDHDSSSPLGNILEFKHPHFRIDSKDDLDNIRRKAPAPRKAPVSDDITTTHHINAMSEQLAATQQQVQQLQELYGEVLQTNKILVNEVLNIQKILSMQKQASHEVLNYLTPYEGATSAVNNHGNHSGANGANGNGAQPVTSNGRGGAETEEPVPELRRARELLTSINTETAADRELDRLQHMYGSPADSSAMVTPTSMGILSDPMHDINRYPVYPVGQTVGIDPFHADHINKIPYAVPADLNPGVMMERTQITQPPQGPGMTATAGPTNGADSVWAKKPLVLLVEDDPTCTKIGIKFLGTMGCEVKHAPNGAEAYSLIINGPDRDNYDMIFMDIIMPRLDGVSATMYIRQTNTTIPIIAMTSNIRPEEVNGYFEHGMNGVLAKPFTRDGLSKSIRAHLGHLMKNPPNDGEMGSSAGYYPLDGQQQQQFLHQNPAKYEAQTPPANAQNWSTGLDQGYFGMNGGGQYNNIGSNPHSMYSTNMSSADTNSRLSDGESPPVKRQRTTAQGY